MTNENQIAAICVTSQPMIIRSEQHTDLEPIRLVHLANFPTPIEARLVDHLRQSGHLLVSLVAEAAGGIVGHVAFSPVHVKSGKVGVGLAPVSVVESHRRQGIAA